MLYVRQDSLGLISFEELARRVGVQDLPRFTACTSRQTRVPAIDQGTAAAIRLHAEGTPALIINGNLLASLPDSAALDGMLSQAKEKAKQLPAKD
jgi:protein-disulfide isomerase